MPGVSHFILLSRNQETLKERAHNIHRKEESVAMENKDSESGTRGWKVEEGKIEVSRSY